ncbi:MAG TPA: glutathione peroxidase [Abditibacteriaceae bacterium]
MHSFKVKDIAGKDVNLADYKGKTVLLVNTASRCGFTKQYDGLEKLYKANKDKDFVILGFPSNDFGGQEPGSDEEIATFCKANFGVTFPLFSKIAVKGDNAHPLYKWLTSEKENPNFAGPVGWNFTKFLINKEGEVVARFASNDAPESDKVQSAVAKAIEGEK